MKNLGYENGWGSSTPQIVLDCRKAIAAGEKHDKETVETGRCLSQTTCKTCGYTYSTDSGD